MQEIQYIAETASHMFETLIRDLRIVQVLSSLTRIQIRRQEDSYDGNQYVMHNSCSKRRPSSMTCLALLVWH
jgi:hypothetical protein